MTSCRISLRTYAVAQPVVLQTLCGAHAIAGVSLEQIAYEASASDGERAELLILQEDGREGCVSDTDSESIEAVPVVVCLDLKPGHAI